MADPLPSTTGGPIAWLLLGGPALRYRALQHLTDRPADDPVLLATRAAIPTDRAVRAILEAQRPDGYWTTNESTYFPKYVTTHWQMILLAELGLPGDHPAVQRGLAAMAPAIAAVGADDALEQGEVIWCYSGNTLRYLCLYGLGQAPMTGRALAQLLRLAESNPTWTCPYNDKPDSPPACLWGAIKVLRALEVLPDSLRTPAVENLQTLAAKALLSHDFAAQQVGRTRLGWVTDWFAFGFPGFYESDLLEGLEALAALGYGSDPRFRRWLPAVLDQQDDQGRWLLRNSLNGHMIVDLETPGMPSRWVTLRARRTLALANQRHASQQASG